MLTLRTDDITQTYFGIYGSCVWIKVLYHFRLNSLFGPLLTIFSNMTKILLQYLELVLLVTFVFGGYGRIQFNIS